MALLDIKNLHVSVEGKEILKGLSLSLEKGKVNVIMGPNGSGKSTLANVLMGHPKYTITSGGIMYQGEDLTHLSPDQRAKKGIFLSFQYPKEIPGVTIANFLRTALNAKLSDDENLNPGDFMTLLEEKMKILGMNEAFTERYLNQGFSGGEKKKTEILQMLVLNPTLVILDETDSGLDIDALRVVAHGVNTFMNKDKCMLIITHYKRLLDYIKPDKLFIMMDGHIKLTGGAELVDHLEEKGYGWVEEEKEA